MTAPDTGGEEIRRAYRAELARYLLPWRVGGLIAVVAGAVILMIGRAQGPEWAWLTPAGWAVVIAGWAVLAVVIFKRSAYHRRRISGV